MNATASNLPAVIQEVRGQLNRMDGEFRAALPSHITVEKFKRTMMTAVQQNPDLLRADRRSLFNAGMKAATDGLLPDGREAALVMFGSQAQYMPMVKGVLKLVRNSGELSSITSQIVCRHDAFRYWVDADGEHINHEPLLFGERGEMVGVYALAKTKDGAVYIETMTKGQVDKVRKVSKSANKGPWVDWYEEMARKTSLRRLSKRLPMSTDVENVLRREEEQYSADVPPRPARADFEGMQIEGIADQAADDRVDEFLTAVNEFGEPIYEGTDMAAARRAVMEAIEKAPDEGAREAIREANGDILASTA